MVIASNSNLFGKITIVFMVLVCSVTTSGKVIYVDYDGPADFHNIQEAIDNANDCDEIEVSPGIYYESIDFKGKAVRLYSSSGPDVTIIRGAFSSVVKCISGEEPNTVLSGFTITGGNSASSGGGMYCESSSPTVSNCIFRDNSALWGGGMLNNDSNVIVTNCSFTSNTATKSGAGMYNARSSPMVTNCMFTGNSATEYGGGGMLNHDSNVTVTNCTFSQNTVGSFGGGMYNLGSSVIVTNCILWGNASQEIYNRDSTPTVIYSNVQGCWYGLGNICVDPCFVDAATHDLRLRPNSPCIDAGDNTAVPPSVVTDLDGNPRIVHGTVDMGAFEFQLFPIHNITQDTHYTTIQAAIDAASNGDEIEVSPGIYYESIDFKGKAVRLYSSSGQNLTTIDGSGHYHVMQCVRGEDANTILEGFTIKGGNAMGDGSGPPYNHTYFGGGMCCIGTPPYPGVPGSPVSPTVKDCTFRDNSAWLGGGIYNSISISTVTNCTFNNNSAYNDGSGMYNYNSSPTVTDCTFSSNSANDEGGGMHNYGSYPIITNCTFSSNSADYGGAMYCIYSSPMVTNCTFSGNSADYSGGGMHNYSSGPMVTNCTFSSNSADYGGAMYWSHSSLIVTNCCFSSNSADYGGGGIFYDVPPPPPPPPPPHYYSDQLIGVSTLMIYDQINLLGNPNLKLTNCTFADNSASNGNAIAFDSNELPGSVQITNCILWDGECEISNGVGSSITITYSNIQGGQNSINDPCKAVIWGEGNIDTDPCFVDETKGDLHLKSKTGRWDANSQNWVQDNVTSSCIDAGNPGCPLRDEPNDPNNIRINMGAYGDTSEASKTPANWRSIADLTNDWVVDFNDLRVFVSYWLETGRCVPSDFNRSQNIDFFDYTIFVHNWLKGKGN